MHVGDEPAQRRHCGLMEGGAKHFCTLCTHAAGTKYDPKNPKLRDFSAINNLWNQFLDLEESKRGEIIQKKKKDAETQLRATFNELSVSHMKSPFADAPLGVNNNVFAGIVNQNSFSSAEVLILPLLLIGAPYCRLHTIDGGVMKNAVINVLIIIERVSKADTFQGAAGLLDDRLAKMCFVPETVHLKWPIFPDGLFQYVKSKSVKEKGLSGGSFGRMRSSWFPDILLQLHFAIDYDGKVLPATDTFEYSARSNTLGGNKKGVESVVVGNVTKIVQRAILALLDFFYSICRAEFNRRDIEDIEKLSLHAYQQFQDLDHLKRELLFDNRGSMMRKTHYLFHTGYWIRCFGSVSQFNTESFEAAHRAFTTGNYEQTSKRHSTMNKEMHLKSLWNKHLELTEFRSKMIGNDVIREKYVKKCGPRCFPATLELSKVSNTKEVLLKRSGDTFQFAKEKVTCPFHPNTDLKNIADLFKDIISENSYENWQNEVYGIDGIGNMKVSIIYGVTYRSSMDSDLGSGHLYAHHAYGGSVTNKRPRYDFIQIEYENDVIPAQIIALIQVENTKTRELKFFGVCLYLKIVDTTKKQNKAKTTKKTQPQFAGLRIPFKHYQYNCANKYLYAKDLVDLSEQMIRPAIVIPRFSMSGCVHGKPSMEDRFFLIDLHYIDRSGWPDLITKDTKERLQMEREIVTVGGIEGGDVEAEEYVDDDEDAWTSDDEGAGAVAPEVVPVVLGEESRSGDGGYCDEEDSDTSSIGDNGGDDAKQGAVLKSIKNKIH